MVKRIMKVTHTFEIEAENMKDLRRIVKHIREVFQEIEPDLDNILEYTVKETTQSSTGSANK